MFCCFRAVVVWSFSLVCFFIAGRSDGVRGANEEATLAENRSRMSQVDAVRNASAATATTLKISANIKVIQLIIRR